MANLKKPEGEKFDKPIMVRVTEKEREDLNAMAQQQGISLSAEGRKFFLGLLKKHRKT